MAVKTLAIIPAIGKVPKSKRFLKKGLVRLNNRSLIRNACLKALEVADMVAVFSDDNEVLEEARRCKVLDISATRMKYVQSMSDGLAYYKAILGVTRKDKNFLPDILLVVNYETPFSTVEDFEVLREALPERISESSVTAYRCNSHFWRSPDEQYTQGVPEWDWDEPIFVDARLGYGVWLGDFMTTRHLKVGRAFIREVPQWRSLRISSEADLRLAKTLSKGNFDV